MDVDIDIYRGMYRVYGHSMTFFNFFLFYWVPSERDADYTQRPGANTILILKKIINKYHLYLPDEFLRQKQSLVLVILIKRNW